MTGLPTELTSSLERIEIDASMLAALAREVAMDINDLPVILGHYGLSEAQYAEIRGNATFRRLLDGAVQAWASAANTPERIRIQAAAAFEVVMPRVAKRLMDDKEKLDDVVKGARMFADVAGLGPNVPGTAGERVTINIDLGADKLTLTHAVKPVGPPEPSDREVVMQAAQRAAIIPPTPVPRRTPVPAKKYPTPRKGPDGVSQRPLVPRNSAAGKPLGRPPFPRNPDGSIVRPPPPDEPPADEQP